MKTRKETLSAGQRLTIELIGVEAANELVEWHRKPGNEAIVISDEEEALMVSMFKQAGGENPHTLFCIEEFKTFLNMAYCMGFRQGQKKSRKRELGERA